MKKRLFLLSTLFLLISCNGNTSSDSISFSSPSSNSISVSSTSSSSSNPQSVSSAEHSHSLHRVPANSAGYAKEGNKEYYTCSGCDKIFLDANGNQETTLEEVKIPSETGFVQKQFAKDNKKLNYCEYKPNKINGKIPLVLFLHGAGERGDNNESQLKNAILKVVNKNSNSQFNNSLVVAPQCPNQPTQWVQTPWSNGNYSLANVNESEPLYLASELIKQYRSLDFVDTNRVYVVGLSMGGFGTWDLISRHQELFTAAVPICGGGPTDKIDVLKDFPIYTFHGTNDSTVPYAGTNEMVSLIKEQGGKNIHFVSFTGDGHGIWDKAITYQGDKTHPSLENWLFSQNKDTANKITRVACVGDSLTYGHAWHNESYPVYLQEKLGNKYIVDNFGVNGAQITGFGGSGSQYKYADINAYTNSVKFCPDILLIMLGTNDATKWDDAKYLYEREFKKLIKSYQEIFPVSEIVLMTSPATMNNNNFGIPNDKIKEFVNPLQKKLASDLKLPLIDIREAFETKQGGYESLIRPNDGVHFSVEGAQFVAEEVAKAISKGLANYLIDFEYENPINKIGNFIIEEENDFSNVDEIIG